MYSTNKNIPFQVNSNHWLCRQQLSSQTNLLPAQSIHRIYIILDFNLDQPNWQMEIRRTTWV